MDGRGAAFGWPLLFGDSTLRTFVYVDAFNLYDGALRKSVLLHGFTKKIQATPQADLDSVIEGPALPGAMGNAALVAG